MTKGGTAVRSASLTRRALVGAFGSGALLAAPVRAAAPDVPRVVALDWGVAATMVAMGTAPLGVPVPPWYARVVIEPSLPGTTVDIGLLNAPNFELIQALAPTLIVIPPSLRQAEDLLARIAPVEVSTLALAPRSGLAAVETETRRLGQRLGVTAEAEGLVADTRRRFEIDRKALTTVGRRPVLIGSFVDDLHLLIQGETSLTGRVATELGLRNVGQDLLPVAADAGILGLQSAAKIDVEHFIEIATDVRQGATSLSDDPIRRALPFMRQDRAIALPPIYRGGGLPAMARFSRLLGAAFT